MKMAQLGAESGKEHFEKKHKTYFEETLDVYKITLKEREREQKEGEKRGGTHTNQAGFQAEPTVCSTWLYLLVLKVFKTLALKLWNDLQMNAVAVVKI